MLRYIALAPLALFFLAALPGQVSAGPKDLSGPFLGAHGGVALLEVATSVTQPVAGGRIESKKRISFSGGGQVGWNHQMDQFVLGAEGDFSFFDLGIEDLVNGGVSAVNVRTQYDWMATIRGRGGMVYEEFLFFGTAGAAFLGGDISVDRNPGAVFRNDDVLTGWTAGGGIEWAFMDGWSVKLEYLYADFGRHSVSLADGGGATVAQATPDIHSLRLGFNFNFCTGGLC